MVISEFQGEYRYLSNFWDFKVPIVLDGIEFFSVETAYQAAKTLDQTKRIEISKMDVRSAKQVGKTLLLRMDWPQVKLDIMLDLVRQKFFNNPELAQLLLKTGNAQLVEGNWWNDTFWGVCRGKGENHLGKILMKVRAELTDRFYSTNPLAANR